jgi:hypothetical protein
MGLIRYKHFLIYFPASMYNLGILEYTIAKIKRLREP